ncbi:MAG TPA: DUF2220 family protein [Saprospiraceae bacterium]|nr:DUF2220 family protein [Saprospiraceae bacterium]
MISHRDLRRRAERAYAEYLQVWLRGESYQPVTISSLGDSLYANSSERAAWLTELQAHSKAATGYGYTVDLQTRNTRAAATQSLVQRVVFETLPDLLHFLGKNAEFESFSADVALLRRSLPELENWIQFNWKQVIAYAGLWPQLLEVCLFFKNYPRPALHLRELPISSDTKFVESHSAVLISLLDALLPEIPNPAERDFARRYGLLTDEPRIRFRWLDPVSAQTATNGYSDLSVLQNEFARHPLPCRTVLVVENKTNLLAVEKMLYNIQMPEAIVVFGSGFGVARLREATWLHERNLLYWGDLDVHGFQILNQMRGYFPHAKSVLMDRSTFEACRDFAISSVPTTVSELSRLTPGERELFLFLKEKNWRIEQEKIDPFIVRIALSKAST